MSQATNPAPRDPAQAPNPIDATAPERTRDRRASFSKLLALAREEWRSLAAGTFFLVVGSVAGLLYPRGMQHIIDGALSSKDGLVGQRALVDQAAVEMVVLAIVQSAAVALRFWFFSVSGERIVTRLRQRLYRTIMKQEVAFFDERRTGELTSRLSSDTGVLQSAVSANISMLLRNGAQVVGGVGFLFATSRILTALMLAIVPAVAVGAVVYGRRLRKLSKEAQDALAAAGEVAEESISGLRTVRSFAAEEMEGDRYATAVERSFSLSQRRATNASIFMAAASSASFIAAALVFWYGAGLVMGGKMTVGELASFLVYTLFVAFALGALADLWAEFMRALGAAERVFELIEREPAIPPHGGETIAAPEGRVTFEDVGFSYPTRADVPVLRGVRFEIAPGEVVALVGPSGAGKTTLTQLVPRLYDVTSGAVRVDGIDVRDLTQASLRRAIGVVSQAPHLFHETVAENLRYAKPDATQEEMEAAARAARIHDVIEAMPDGYRTVVGERGHRLSGGEQQRLAIARMLLKDPAIVILDEATSSLDSENEAAVQQALATALQGRTSLVIAHRLSTITDADRILVLDHGRLVEQGRHQELLDAGGLYADLYRTLVRGDLTPT
mgnify:CR=1 FL=1